MEAGQIVHMLIALFTVLALLGLFALALRRFGPMLGLTVVAPNVKARRMSVVEVLMLDGRHRAVILRSDGADHTVILGGANPVVLPGRNELKG